MKKLLLLAALGLFGCQKKYAELDFFEVRIKTDPEFRELGKAELMAEIFNSTGSAAVDQCGFLFSENLADIDASVLTVAASNQILATPPASGNGDFSAILTVEPSKTLFVRPFARLGERQVLGEIKVIGLPVLVEMLVGSPRVLNDNAWPEALLIGLNSLPQKVVAHGHVFSPTDADPKVGSPNCDSTDLGPATADKQFESHLANLQFNQDYWVRAYVKSASGAFFYSKKVVAFRVRGGWRRVADFPMDYFSGSAGVFNGSALASFGSNLIAPSQQNQYPRNAWTYHPASNEWQEIAPYSAGASFAFAQTNAANFVIGGRFYAISGDYFEPALTFLNQMMIYDFSAQTWSRSTIDPLMRYRTGAAAFSINGKGYFGGGQGKIAVGGGNFEPIDYNDFWEFDPQTGNWRKVKSMPIQVSPISPPEAAGRREASVFESSSGVWVGGGATGGLKLRDFWQFVPPASPTDSGQWISPIFFPGKARTEAVSFAAGGRFFYGLGNDDFAKLDDWWEFNPSSGWLQKNDFLGGERRAAMAFSINGRGYVGTGLKTVLNVFLEDKPTRDFWVYFPDEP